jgi:hypothetical protein
MKEEPVMKREISAAPKPSLVIPVVSLLVVSHPLLTLEVILLLTLVSLGF